MNTPITAVSYSIDTASAATGVSRDVVQRAMRSGDLVVHYPNVSGKQVGKPLILAEDLRAWVAAGKTEREAAA
ncbi:hypothetical protein ACFS27_03215 [Promicromonospora vindobonensis]|uniref:Helix-turn-helix domain-containing protein n=1 Tax=Promicromonospora vindobonensis TaxID=195748 RepID=A0ABW5VQ42_9MICO